MSTFSILDNYSALRREISLMFADGLKNSNLGHQQAVILYHLSLNACAMSELSAYTQADPASTTRTVASLERQGLVVRKSDALDARKTIVEITNKGMTRAKFTNQIRGGIGDVLNSTLNKQEREIFEALLKKVAVGLQANRKK